MIMILANFFGYENLYSFTITEYFGGRRWNGLNMSVTVSNVYLRMLIY